MIDATWSEVDAWEQRAVQTAVMEERQRCLRIIQRLREQGDADLRDARDWIEAGDDVDEGEPAGHLCGQPNSHCDGACMARAGSRGVYDMPLEDLTEDDIDTH